MEETDYESMSSEEAVSQIETIKADEKHPFNSPPGTSGRQDALAHVHNLHLVKHNEYNPAPSGSDTAETLQAFQQAKNAEAFSPEHISAMEKGLELLENRNAEIQTKRIEQAEVEMDKLVKAGYERASIPDNISARQVDVMTMQRMAAEEDYNNLKLMISKNLRDLKVPQDVQNMFDVFNNSTELDPTLRQQMTENVIGWINRARKQKEGS